MHLGALRGASLVTLQSKFRRNDTLVLPNVETSSWRGHRVVGLAGPKPKLIVVVGV